MAWRVGAQVAGYLLEGELGAGGMGTVYRARDLRSGALRALKATPVGLDPEQVLRFQREGEALARAGGHPHVLTVHSAGQAEGRAFLVTDLAEGGSLAERLEAGPLPIPEAVALVADLADAMSHLHASGVLHRDLKPENVLFSGEGRVLLADFGLATLADARSLTTSGVILGTPAYMAPERALGSTARDPLADVYGLGAVLYACLLARPPFAGAGALVVLDRVVNQEPSSPRRERPEVPRWLEALLQRTLAKDPPRRPPTAAALAEALRAGPAGHSDAGRALWVGAVCALLLLGASAFAFAQRGQPADPPRRETPRAQATRPSPRPSRARRGEGLPTREWLPPAKPHTWDRGQAGLVIPRSSPAGPLDVFAWFETTGHLYRWRLGHEPDLLSKPDDLPAEFGPEDGRHWTGFVLREEDVLAAARGPSGLFSLSRHGGAFKALPNSYVMDHRQPTALTAGSRGSVVLAMGSGPEAERRSDMVHLRPSGQRKELRWPNPDRTHYVIRVAESGGWLAAVLELGPSLAPTGYEVVLLDPTRPSEPISVARYAKAKPRCLALLPRPERPPLLLWAGAERDAHLVSCDAPQQRVRVELSDQGSELAWDESRTPRFLTLASEGRVLLGAGLRSLPRKSGRVWLLGPDAQGRLAQRWTRGFERPLAAARVIDDHLVALAQDGSLWIERLP